MDVKFLTESILNGNSIRAVLSESKVFDNIISFIEKQNDRLRDCGFKSTLELKTPGFIWTVNVPKSVQSNRVLEVLNIDDDGTVHSNTSQKFAAPGVMNINKLTDVKGLCSVIEDFVDDLCKDFPKEKEKTEPKEFKYNEDASIEDKILSLPKNLQKVASKGYITAQKLMKTINTGAQNLNIVYGDNNREIVKLKSSKILSGSDNNLYINIEIENRDISEISSKSYDNFRKELIQSLKSKGVISNFVLDSSNRVWFLGFVLKFENISYDDKVKLADVYDGYITF